MNAAPARLATAAGPAAFDGAAAPAVADAASAEPSLRAPVLAGLAIVISCFGSFFGWSLFASLDSAVIANGVVVVDSQRKTVQHLEGGILRELLVREGETVAAGQTVAVLDTTQADAELSQLLNQRSATRAEMARLIAEQRGNRAIDFPPMLREAARDEVQVAEFLEVQDRLFDARWRAHDGAIAVLRQNIARFSTEAAAAKSQLQADTERLALYEEELANVKFLLDKGYERRPRMLELKRTVAEIKGRQGELSNTIAGARAAIAGTELEIANLEQNRLAETAAALAEAQALDADLAQRIKAASDVLERKAVVSPQDGVVVDVRTVTPGGVIGAGQPLMDIVPVDDDMTVETRISPADIEHIRPSLPAEVKLSAYRRADAPVIEGAVRYVSADKLNDPRTNEPYFLVRVELSKASLADAGDALPSPGMPTEVMINTGTRRAIDYFLEPITARMRRSFHEE
jgi:HlyD family secretion protein